MNGFNYYYNQEVQAKINDLIENGNVIIDSDGRVHAGKGGCVGVNGCFYVGGQYISLSEYEPEMRDTAIKRYREDWIASDPRNMIVIEFLETTDIYDSFLSSIEHSYSRNHSLTEKQVNAVIKYIERLEEREREASKNRNSSEYVGTVGDRKEFSLLVEKVIGCEGQFGMYFINLLKDEDGNVFVYMGSKSFGDYEGQNVTVKATVKEHSEYNGVKQTKIARPIVV
jgi:hypothetical protein